MSPCKDRVCTDNITATDSIVCNDYLDGCVTNGNGCIEASASCTAYFGD